MNIKTPYDCIVASVLILEDSCWYPWPRSQIEMSSPRDKARMGTSDRERGLEPDHAFLFASLWPLKPVKPQDRWESREGLGGWCTGKREAREAAVVSCRVESLTSPVGSRSALEHYDAPPGLSLFHVQWFSHKGYVGQSNQLPCSCHTYVPPSVILFSR